MFKHLSKRHCRSRIVLAGALVGVFVFPSDASTQDTLRLRRQDRIRHALISDVEVPPEGKFQVATTAAFFARLNWRNYRSWMFTDDQRFDTDGAFGPVAHIAPADSLDAFTEDRFLVAADTGLNVGAIWVDTADNSALPENYRALKIIAGRNCIRIARVGENWFGYVFPEAPVGNPCPMPAAIPPSLRVQRIAATPFAGGANIPPVARWHEGKRGGRDRMHFGVKCGDYWCMVMPLQASVVDIPHRGNRPNERTWETYGWHDVQRLAVLNAAGRPVPGRVKASIVPAPRLGAFKIADFDTGWVHVAEVAIHGPLNGPNAKYGRPASTTDRGYWGFVQGDSNFIYLRTTTDSTTYPSGWMAEVRHPKQGAFPLLVVRRHDHTGHKIPGTARFRWIDHDDGNWIRCDDGCCKIGVF